MRKRRGTWWVWAAAVAGLSATAGPAGAFYWYGVPERSLIPPTARNQPGNPPGSGSGPTTPPGVVTPPVNPTSPGGNPTPPGGPNTPSGPTPPTQVPGEVKGETPPGVFVPGPETPPGVPEPGTLLAAAVGLGVVAAGRARRRAR